MAIGAKPQEGALDEPAPIACTLTAGDAVDRVDDWAQLLASQTGTPRRSDDGARVWVTVAFASDASVAASAAELAALEQACCAFIDFDLKINRAGLELTATTTLEAASIIDALLGVPA